MKKLKPDSVYWAGNCNLKCKNKFDWIGFICCQMILIHWKALWTSIVPFFFFFFCTMNSSNFSQRMWYLQLKSLTLLLSAKVTCWTCWAVSLCRCLPMNVFFLLSYSPAFYSHCYFKMLLNQSFAFGEWSYFEISCKYLYKVIMEVHSPSWLELFIVHSLFMLTYCYSARIRRSCRYLY